MQENLPEIESSCMSCALYELSTTYPMFVMNAFNFWQWILSAGMDVSY